MALTPRKKEALITIISFDALFLNDALAEMMRRMLRNKSVLLMNETEWTLGAMFLRLARVFRGY